MCRNAAKSISRYFLTRIEFLIVFYTLYFLCSLPNLLRVSGPRDLDHRSLLRYSLCDNVSSYMILTRVFAHPKEKKPGNKEALNSPFKMQRVLRVLDCLL